jgi:hypothetical protein
MAEWRYEIDISMYFTQYDIDDDLEMLKTSVVAEIKRSSAYKIFKSDLDCLCQQLTDVVDDLDEWDEAYEDLADFCDSTRIWLKTQA